MTSIITSPSTSAEVEAMEVGENEDQVGMETVVSSAEAEMSEEPRKIAEAETETDLSFEDGSQETNENHVQIKKVLDPRIAKEFEELRKNIPKTMLLSDDDLIEMTSGSTSEKDDEIKALSDHALNTPLIDVKSMKYLQHQIDLKFRQKIMGGKCSRDYNREVIEKMESELDICKTYGIDEKVLGFTKKEYLKAPFLVNFEELDNETCERNNVLLNGDVIDEDIEKRDENETRTTATDNNMDQIAFNSTNQIVEANTMESLNKEDETLINEEVIPSIEEQEPINVESLVDVVEGEDDDSEEESQRPLIRISSSIFENPNADADSDNSFSNNNKNMPDLIPISTSTILSEGTTSQIGMNKPLHILPGGKETAATQLPASQQFRAIKTNAGVSQIIHNNKMISISTPTGIINLRPHFTLQSLQGQLQRSDQPRLSPGFSQLKTSTPSNNLTENDVNVNVLSSSAEEEGNFTKTKILSPEFHRFLTKFSTSACIAHDYLSCHLCGVTYPFTYDHKYRNHLIIKHQIDVDTQDQAIISKFTAATWLKCRICNAVILNNLNSHKSEHQLNDQTKFVDNCFEKILTSELLHKKITCGICDSFSFCRRLFRTHLATDHPDLTNLILLEPDFRCATCLKKFDDSSLLTKHVSSCRSNGNIPSPETVLELAKSVLKCGVCDKKHKTIEETQKCYSNAKLIRCLFCLQTTNSKKNFVDHMRLFHGNDQSVLCPFCKESLGTSIKDSFVHCVKAHYLPALKEYFSKNTTSPTSTSSGASETKQAKPTITSQASESAITRPAGAAQSKIIRIQSSAGFRAAPFNPNAPGQKNFRPIFVNKSGIYEERQMPKNYSLYPFSNRPTTSVNNSSASQSGNKLIPTTLTNASGTSFKVITSSSSEATKQIIKNIRANNSTSSATLLQRTLSPNKTSQNEIQNTSTGPTTSINTTTAIIAPLDSALRKFEQIEKEQEDDDDDDEIVGL